MDTKLYMIGECIGDSIYECHTIPFAYQKREWAEYQMKVLQEQSEQESNPVTFKIREITVVTEGPK